MSRTLSLHIGYNENKNDHRNLFELYLKEKVRVDQIYKRIHVQRIFIKKSFCNNIP